MLEYYEVKAMQSTNFSKPAFDGDKLLRAEQVAEMCNIQRPTVYSWWRKEILPVVVMGGVRQSWKSDVLAIIQPKTAA